MVATSTHRVTMPKKMSAFLAKRAKSGRTTVSKTVTELLAAQIEYLEEGHIWEEALERKRTSDGNCIPHDEFWKLAEKIPYTPEA